jgi:hypothetical protein
MSTPRQLYMVLSPRSLSYARAALESLFRNAAEGINLHLVTDSSDDAKALAESVTAIDPVSQHRWSVTSEEQLNDAEASVFANLPNLRAFRHGHPCWRKVTDPLLLSTPGEEMILLDPDLYFPNGFRFEETPQTGLSLMWQRPNCLLPPSVVRAAFDAGIRLARHVDIGVSHWRTGSDLAWLDWMLGRLGAPNLPRAMHVEAIVWSAIAMREGGGYLDPRLWVCWRRTQAKRLRRKLGASGERILASEPWTTMKCFHGGGEAKWWVPGYMAAHPVAQPAEVLQTSPLRPFAELTRERYEREQRAKNMLHTLGYYRVFGAKPA